MFSNIKLKILNHQQDNVNFREQNIFYIWTKEKVFI